MIPLYFPFNAASSAATARLRTVFEKLGIYYAVDAPSANAPAMDIDDVFWETLKPVSQDEKKIKAMVKGFLQWITLHEGGISEYLKTGDDRVPFFTDTSVSKIRSDLKNRSKTADPLPIVPAAPEQALTAAGLFLALARAHDLFCFALFKDLADQQRMEQALYDQIKGDPGDLDRLFRRPAGGMDEDQGNILTEKRMTAWSIFLLNDPSPPSVFVTDSPAVMEFLQSEGFSLEPVFTLEGISTAMAEDEAAAEFKRELINVLGDLAEGSKTGRSVAVPAMPRANPGDRTVNLKVAVSPGMTPYRYFSRFAPPVPAFSKKEPQTPSGTTVICLAGSSGKS
jgi:hypothetical protein